MGNLNCTLRKAGVSDWFRSKFKRRGRTSGVIEDNTAKEKVKETQKKNHQEDVDTAETTENDESISPGIYSADNHDRDIEPIDPNEDFTEDKANHFKEIFTNDSQRQTTNAEYSIAVQESIIHSEIAATFAEVYSQEESQESTKDVENKIKANDIQSKNATESAANAEIDTEDATTDDELLDSDRSLRSYGVCVFEDDIPEDPVEASLLASGLDDVNLDTRDAIDVMVMCRTFPLVKAIERIKADERGLSRRKDPIPEGERSGSIQDLGWSRHMRNIEREYAERCTRRRSLQLNDSSQQISYVSQSNKRFSKFNDLGSLDDDEDALDEFLSKRRKVRSRGLTVEADVSQNTAGPGIQRQSSYWNLPTVE